jgi:polar amino acid transport system ATP-binding protein
MADTVLQCESLTKAFGEHVVLKGIDLEVSKGERIAIIGGSGSGKSTLLRCLNFMETPTSGTIRVNGRAVGTESRNRQAATYSEKELQAVRQSVGMVFQQFNLFPHMTVLENVMEGLVTVKKMGKTQAREIACAELNKVGLGAKFDSFPARLSGGQQQRVAIARALAMQPGALLFDEPTSALDPELVGEVLRTIRSLAEEGRTMLLVTHELGFAYHFATRVIYLYDGKIHEQGTPQEIFKSPRMDKTREFIGRSSEFAIH